MWSRPKRFALIRHEDVSGTSGTGVVALGVEFEDGRVVLRWCGALTSTAIYDSADDLIRIHGHEGRTVIMWEV